MKKIFFPIVACVVFFSCKNSTAVSADKTITQNNADSINLATDAKSVLGSYTGGFGDTYITVLLTKANADSVEGSSIIGSDAQPFAGNMHRDGSGAITITAKEPGTEPHDGEFNFVLDKKQPDLLKGMWTPYKTQGKISAKLFALSRKTFIYRPDAGEYPQASARVLKDDDLNNLVKPELEQMRNEIMARHGYSFSDPETRSRFEKTNWYVGCSADVKNALTETEKKNLVLIKKYEKYAQDYGSEFGR